MTVATNDWCKTYNYMLFRSYFRCLAQWHFCGCIATKDCMVNDNDCHRVFPDVGLPKCCLGTLSQKPGESPGTLKMKYKNRIQLEIL